MRLPVWVAALTVLALASPLTGSAASASQPPPASADSGPPGTIEGTTIARPGGRYLGLSVVDGCFRLTFYNGNKKKMPADASFAVLRWPVHYQPNDERDVLMPGDDASCFSSAKVVRPPFFQLLISVFVNGQDDPTETYLLPNFSP